LKHRKLRIGVEICVGWMTARYLPSVESGE
jgi:hypothetical protein